MFKKIKSFFSSVKQKLVKSSTNIKQTVSVVLGDKIEIDEESYEKITDALISVSYTHLTLPTIFSV